MQETIQIIKDWPVIVQGALGSALFWLILLVGQKIVDFTHLKTLTILKRSRRTELINERIRLGALKARGAHKPLHASLLLYRMSRPFLKALIWITLGNIFGAAVGVFSIIGYIGGLYYLFKALDIVKSIKYDGDVDQRIDDIKEELEMLEQS